MPFWWKRAQWQEQFPREVTAQCFANMEVIRDGHEADDTICYCLAWSAANKPGRPAKLSWKCRRHVVTCRHDTTCCSNFGQMGPCRRHKIEDVVAVCVGLSRHFTKFSEFVCRNILYGMGVHTHRYYRAPTSCSQRSFLSCSPVCHVLHTKQKHYHNTPQHNREHNRTMSDSTIRPCLLQRLCVQ
jgi:hypothetical protein